MLKVKEIYLTKQGEGYHTGQEAVFCRFTGCNLWSGLEKDRHKAACRFCDTDFRGVDGVNGGRYTELSLVKKIQEIWGRESSPFVVFTGGEPLLQLKKSFIDLCKHRNFYVALETNGTKVIPNGIDWVCVSPKPRSTIVIRKASELKLVYPQREPEMAPENFVGFDAGHRYLQPLDNKHQKYNIQLANEYCQHHPDWKVSIQTHKILGIP